MKKEYKTEEEFLKDYNSKDFDQLSMTSDILLISVSDEESNNYRKTSKKMMSILLVKRDDYPYKGKWCLPGGFLNPKTETLEDCAKRLTNPRGRSAISDDSAHIYIKEINGAEKLMGVLFHRRVKTFAPMYDRVYWE